MFTLQISTDGPDFQGTPDADRDPIAGEVLAKYLRAVADRVEREVSIVPGRSGDWTPEHYRVPGKPVNYSITAP